MDVSFCQQLIEQQLELLEKQGELARLLRVEHRRFSAAPENAQRRPERSESLPGEVEEIPTFVSLVTRESGLSLDEHEQRELMPGEDEAAASFSSIIDAGDNRGESKPRETSIVLPRKQSGNAWSLSEPMRDVVKRLTWNPSSSAKETQKLVRDGIRHRAMSAVYFWCPHTLIETVGMLAAIASLVNMFALGLSLDYAVGSLAWFVLDLLLALIFTADLFTRLLANGLRPTLFGSASALNWLDVVLTVAAVLQLTLANADNTPNWVMSNEWRFALRILRLFKIFRLFEVRGLARSEIGDFLDSLLAGFSAFKASVLPSFLIAYSFAIPARIFLGGCDREELGLTLDQEFFPCRQERGQGEINVYFGSVGKSMWTVALCGFGYCYTEQGRPLELQFFETWPNSQRVFARLCYILFLSAWNFWLVNVIVATIVEITSQVLRASPRARQRNRRLKEEIQQRQLTKLLEHFIDDDNELPLRVSLMELRHMLSKEGVQEQMEEIGWPVSSHFALQQYLGRRGENEVSMSELVEVLTDMKGTATTIDIQLLQGELRKVAK